MEEIIDGILETFNFENYCVICNNLSDICVPPSYCSKAAKLLATGIIRSVEEFENVNEFSRDQTLKEYSRLNSQNNNLPQAQNVKNPRVDKFNIDPNDKLTVYFRGNEEYINQPVLKNFSQAEKGESVVISAMNPGGINIQKSKVIEKLVAVNRISILVVSETGTSGTDIPRIGGMVPFHRNRNSSGISRGGVAVFVTKDIAPHCVVMDKGAEDEYVAVRMNCFSPPLVVVGLYGRQETGPREKIREMWRRIFAILDSYRDQGSRIIMTGDFNMWVGRCFGLKDNDPKVSTGGKEFIKLVMEGGWRVMNRLSQDDSRTHLDRTSGSERCLDYFLTNSPEIFTEVSTDPEREATPYKIIMKKNKPIGRKLTDHRSILANLNIQLNVKKGKSEPRFIKSKESILRFKEHTDRIAIEITPLLDEKEVDIDSVINKTNRSLLRAKYACHKVMRATMNQQKKLDDLSIFWYETDQLEKEEKNLEMMRLNNKIFKVRRDKILGERKNDVSAMKDIKGNVAVTREEVVDMLLDHNEKLLGRQDHTDGFKEIADLKVKLMEELVDSDLEEFEAFTKEEFNFIVKRIEVKNKRMFHDFIESGDEFKELIFKIVKFCYEKEIIPNSFQITDLVALYKKGDPSSPDNYRYLHIKFYLARILEMAIAMKLAPTFNDHTGSTQLGGMPDGECTEHLVLMMSMINHLEMEGEGGILTFCDIKKCFDSVFLSDMCWFLLKNDADLKAVKLFQLLTGTNRLRIQGSEKEFVITNGIGQGGNVAARATSAGMAECTERWMKNHPDPMFLRGVNVGLDEFVDDTKTSDKTAVGSKVSGEILTNAFNELSVAAHPDKTVQILVGNENWIGKMEEELKQNPTFIQGFEVKRVMKDKYLGMVVHRGGVKETIAANIRDKKSKIEPTVQKIRNFVRNNQILRLGRLKTVALLIQAQIIPALLYDTESWLFPTKDNYKDMEDILKGAMLKIMSLPPSTNYESMLWEIGNFHMQQWIELGKLRFFSKKMNLKSKGRMYEVLREEIIAGDKKGFAEEMDILSRKYGLPNVMLHYVRPEDISERVKEFSRDRICHEVLLRKSIPIILNTRKVLHEHQTFTPMEERAITCFNTGNLVFKDTCPNKFKGKHEDRWCLVNICEGRDSYHHVRYECQFYSTKYVNTGNPVRDNSKYLVALDRERQKRWKIPLIVVSGYL